MLRFGAALNVTATEVGDFPQNFPKTSLRTSSPRNGRSRKALTYGSLRQARATGIEPATTGSTVRYSNQLSYAPVAS
jgi:hypothetical protein